MTLPNRSGSVDSYRYGFQGQEKDDEVKDVPGSSLNYKYRMHDPRVGRFFAVDPLASKFPWYSPYQFAGNSVIQFGELEGLEMDYARAEEAKYAYYAKLSKENNVEELARIDAGEKAHIAMHEGSTEFMNDNLEALLNPKQTLANTWWAITNPIATLGGMKDALFTWGANITSSDRVTRSRAFGQGIGFGFQMMLPSSKFKLTKIPDIPVVKKATNVAEVEVPIFERLLKEVDDLDFSTPKDGAVFWSGPGRMSDAQRWAKLNDKFTLELTPGGKYLDDLKLFDNIDGGQAAQIWDIASKRFAKEASGSVNVFSTGTSKYGQWGLRTWWKIEKPALLDNVNIESITRRKKDGSKSVNGHVKKTN